MERNDIIGDYLIIVDVDPNTEEMYRFQKDNSSIWYFGCDAKFGTWHLEANKLIIKTQGYTGEICEEYELTNNIWINIQFPERKLKKKLP